MAKITYPDFFNDVFGPIMQPGSSGSFAGVCRIGNIARALARGKPERVRFSFNPDTRDFCDLVNFMSDRGYLGGVLGLATDDVRLFEAHALARQQGLIYDFAIHKENNSEPDSVVIEITDTAGRAGHLWATSIGGGMIRIHAVNGFPLDWQADTHALLLPDPQGEITPVVLEALSQAIGEQLVDLFPVRHASGAVAYFVEMAAPAHPGVFAVLSPGVRETSLELPALLPVVTRRDRKPQLFQTIAEWREVADNLGVSFAQAAVEYEKASSGWTDQEVWDYFTHIREILTRQINSLEEVGFQRAQDTALLPIYGRKWQAHVAAGRQISDTLSGEIIRYAFSTNAKLPGFPIVPGPMGTGGGYLFSALKAVQEKHGFSEEKLLEALAVAAGLGALAYTHTNASGQVGCVGETGVCCAMASGALVWLAGGDGQQVENAASMALQANLGIPCDPMAGGLEFPCLTRTFRTAITAPLYADLALAGIDPLVPFHELLQEIERHSSALPSGEIYGPACGCNNTPTAARLRRDMVAAGLTELTSAKRKESHA